MRGRRGFMDGALDDLEALRQAIVKAHRYAAGRYTNQLLQFGDIERVVRFLQQVIATDSQHDFLLLVDDMRGEHEGLLETRGIHHLQHHVVGMPMQFIGVMYLDKLDVMRFGQALQRLRQRTFPALRQANDGYFVYLAHRVFSRFQFCAAKLLLFRDIHNTYL